MRRIVFLCMFIFSLVSFAQNSINHYKYVIVPSKFDFLKQPDKYQTSSLTKFLLEKEGFTVFLDNEELPLIVKQNRCASLLATIKSTSTMLMTKNTLELKDCNNKILFTSSVGKSRQKEFKKAYHQAIREAFQSLTAFNYSYKPLKNKNSSNNSTTEPVVIRKDEVSRRNTVKTINKKNEVVNREGINKDKRIPTLQAKLIKNGYQLINVKGQTVFDVLYTKLDKVFVIKDKNGVFYKGNNNWVAEFYDAQGNKVLKEFILDVPLR